MTRALEGQIDRLKARLLLAAGRFILRRLNDGGELMEAQVTGMESEAHDTIEVMHHYGVTSRPPKGSEGVLVSIAGVRSAGVIVATTHRDYRLKLEADGEVALFDDLGQVVRLKRSGIEITSPMAITVTSAASIDMEAPQINLIGDVLVDGDLLVTGDGALTGDLAVDGDTQVDGNFAVDGQWTLGTGAVLAPKLSDNSNATTGKAK